MGITVSFAVRSAFCEMPDPVCLYSLCSEYSPGRGAEKRGEDVGQGECNREMLHF